MFQFLAELGVDPLAAEYEDLLAFVARPGRRGAEARCTEITHVRSFYRWAAEHRLVDVNPAERLRRPKRRRGRPRPMPDAALTHALTHAPQPIRTWIYLAAYAGLRCCEIAPLHGMDYRRTRGLLVIREQKGGDSAAVPVPPILAEQLAGLPRDDWWFTRWDGVHEPISAGQLQRHANRWLHSQGIAHTMHTCRHWFGTYVYRASGRDLRLTQELMRHASPAHTAIYTEVDEADVVEVVSRLPRLDGATGTA